MERRVGKGDGEEASGRNAAEASLPPPSFTDLPSTKRTLGGWKGERVGGVGWLTLFFGKSTGFVKCHGIFRIKSLIFVKSESQESA